MRRLGLVLLLALLTAAGALPAQAPERRTALVIGNGAYRDAPLRNPVNDARAISESLKRCGFQVTRLENATREQMRAGLRAFGEEIRKGGVGLFYFAGHGMQVKGRNFLIPVGADISLEDEVASEALDTDAVLAKMESAGNRLNVVVLDACRNNPFGRSFRSSSAGLAQMDAPKGTYIAFATAPGRTAADGSGAHGLYTQHLLANLETPGLRIEDVFKRVRSGVLKASADQQMPWDSSSLTGDFYFMTPGKGGAAPSAPEPAAPEGLGGSATPIVLEHPETELARTDLETPAAFARRIAALPPVSLGKAYLRPASYHPDARRLPVGLWFPPWVGPYIPVRFGIMDVELGLAEARKVAAESTEYPLVGRFSVAGDRVTCTLQVLFSEGARPLLPPFPTPPARPAPGQVWFEPAAGLELCWIPPGTFTMGSPPGEAKRQSNEGPTHGVTLAQGFWMGRCEVTQGQYMALARGNPSKFRTDAHFNPVEQVSWDEARAWIAQLNAKAGTTLYRLPSEAEWEYACRAGNPAAGYGAPGAIGWSKLNSGQYTHPIPGITLMGKYSPHRAGTMAPNAWGLCDLLGNVAEWCEDVYHPDYTGAPTDGRPWREGGDPARRVVRGGDWDHSASNLRAAFRAGEKPDRKDSTIGFRVVREAAARP